ncbi:MAG: hypothetical protein Kow0075_14010 [Salibacteraceae bacterium]
MTDDLAAQHDASELHHPKAESVMSAYDSSTMVLYNNYFTVGGKVSRYGFFNQKLKDELRKSSSAWELYKVYQRKLRLGLGLSILSLPGLFLGGMLSNPALIITSVVPYTVGMTITATAHDSKQAAVAIYNREMFLNSLKSIPDL